MAKLLELYTGTYSHLSFVPIFFFHRKKNFKLNLPSVHIARVNNLCRIMEILVVWLTIMFC